MKTICTKILSAVIVMMFAVSGFNSLKAQTNNTIREVQLSNNDGFNHLRNIISTNFDFTNQDLKEGIVNSEVAFDLSADGKITNVHASSDCSYVAKELENIFSSLQLTIKPDQLNKNVVATTYVMPVRLNIDNR